LGINQSEIAPERVTSFALISAILNWLVETSALMPDQFFHDLHDPANRVLNVTVAVLDRDKGANMIRRLVTLLVGALAMLLQGGCIMVNDAQLEPSDLVIPSGLAGVWLVGPIAHAEARGFASVMGLRNHLFGLAAYARQIDKVYGGKLLADLKSVPWPL